MTLRVMPLEDRIVFDAAGVADTDHSTEAPEAVMPEPAQADATQPAETEAAEAPDADAAEAPAFDGAAEAPHADPPVRVLVVSSAVTDADALAEAAADPVRTVTYDAATADLDTLLAQIQEALHGQQADSIAFATHGTDLGNFVLARNQVVNLANTLGSAEQQAFWTALSESIKADGRIDIMACDVASTQGGEQLVTELENLTGLNVAASDDLTGNADAGGDWVLETDNVDLVSTYFDADALDHFQGTLPGWSPDVERLEGDVQVTGIGGSVLLDSGPDAAVWDEDFTGYGGVDGYLRCYINAGGAGADAIELAGLTAGGGADGNGYELTAGFVLEKDGTAIGNVTGYGTADMKVDWNNNATNAHATYIIRHLQYTEGAGTNGTREFWTILSDASGMSSWNYSKVHVQGPVVTANSATFPGAGGEVVLDTGDLNVTDADEGDANLLEFQIIDDPIHGQLYYDFDPTAARDWQPIWSGDTFTLEDLNPADARVKYVHTAADPVFDSFSFEVTDVTHSQTSAETNFLLDAAGNAQPVVDLDPWGVGTTRSTWFSFNEFATHMAWNTDDLDVLDDSAQIKSVTATLTNPLDGGNEGLDYTAEDMQRAAALYGITVTMSGGGNVVTLTSTAGTKSGEYFEAALLRLGYWHAYGTRTSGYRYINVVANDGAQNGNTAQWQVEVEPDTGQPVVAYSYAQLHRGTDRVINGAYLKTVDSNTGPGSLVYTIDTMPWDGMLLYNGAPAWVGLQFTQADVDAGRLVYHHSGNGVGWTNDGFNFQVTDGTTVQWGMMQLDIVPQGEPLWEPGEPGDFGDEFFDDAGDFADDFFSDDVGEFFGEMGDPFDISDKISEAFAESDAGSTVDAEEVVDQAVDTEVVLSQHEAFDNLLDAFSGNQDASSLFAGAVKAIQESEALTKQTDVVTGLALDFMDGLEGPMQTLVKGYINEVAESLVAMRGANGDLTRMLLEAQHLGPRFDKALGDAISASVADLNTDNDHVAVTYAVLDGVVKALQANTDELDAQRLRRLAAQAQEAAEAKIAQLAGRRDKATKDAIAASLQRLLSGQEGQKPVAPPTPGPAEGGPPPVPEGQPTGEQQTPGEQPVSDADGLGSATAFLQRTRCPNAADLLQDLVNASSVSRN